MTVSAESQKTANEMGKSEPPKASAAAGSELSKPASTPSSEKKDYTIKQYRPSQSSLYEMAVTPEDQGQMDSRPLNKAVSDEQKHLQLKKAPLDHSGKAGTTDAKNSGEREQEGFDAFVSMFAQRLHFTSDGRAIIVYIIEPAEKQAKRDGREFPQSFPVRITRRDSSSLEMVWQLDLPLVKMDTDEVGVEMLPDQIMRVVFEDAQVSYRVDLKADSTSAISEK
ncbi:hypothetical protein GWN42_10275 [candidate division KSB1 bacterium]|nr:hypothetical protein [candidate division KSB1 bacterium]